MNPNIAKRRHAKTAHLRQDNGQGRAKHPINVGATERQLSMVGGSVLAVYGLLRGSLSGLTLAAIGGALIWRGHTGHCEVYHALGHSSAEQSQRKQSQRKQSGGTEPREQGVRSPRPSPAAGDGV